MKLHILILTFILIVSCNSADEIFVFYKTDLISKSICKNNKIKNRIDILHNLVSNKRDIIRLLEFDKKGNLTEISINAGKLKYYYNDPLLNNRLEVVIGSRSLDDGTRIIGQFYPNSGNEMITFSKRELEAFKKILYYTSIRKFEYHKSLRIPYFSFANKKYNLWDSSSALKIQTSH